MINFPVIAVGSGKAQTRHPDARAGNPGRLSRRQVGKSIAGSHQCDTRPVLRPSMARQGFDRSQAMMPLKGTQKEWPERRALMISGDDVAKVAGGRVNARRHHCVAALIVL
jgi:hypothetical protein